VHQITALFMATLAINIVSASLVGRAVGRFGERAALILECRATRSKDTKPRSAAAPLVIAE
tara:strand:+ start:225 stop:407 length:183 start_codon:yes stop_codon:yes gene_type:complete